MNPDAPKGGEIALPFVGTLDSLNPYNGQGRAHLFSIMHYESLLGEAPSNVSVPADVYGESYCLLCERLEYPADKDWVTFFIRPEARFSDGSPVTAQDIEFSFNLITTQGLPSYAQAVSARIDRIEVIDDLTIRFYFAKGIPRRSLIETVGGVPAWSKDWFEETGTQLSDTWTTPPLGSGPYRLVEHDLTRRMRLELRDDYWGADLPFNQGRNNFQTIRLEIFGDDNAAFEAFKSGEYTFRTEGDSRKWATGYTFPKVKEGSVVTDELPNGAPPAVNGIMFNLGREVLQDVRVRDALALAFNFEWTNESLLNSLFQQRASFSQDTPIMAMGAPTGAELAFLQSLDAPVPGAILTEAARVPHSSNGTRLLDRRNIRAASRLLDDAGWTVGDDGIRRNADGDLLELSFLRSSSSTPTGAAVMENFASNVETLGVKLNLDVVDTAQFTARERDRDYDLISETYSPFLGTGTGLAQQLGSETAAFSLFNPAGFSSPLTDEIIERSLLATSREEEVVMLMALDRVLRHEAFMIPLWYNPSHWVAYYDMYEHPDPIPPYALGHLDFWWYNADKAADLRAAGALR
ncbi:MAG: extracellular solute-binding protein [Pseudomonadota bacterium]